LIIEGLARARPAEGTVLIWNKGIEFAQQAQSALTLSGALALKKLEDKMKSFILFFLLIVAAVPACSQSSSVSPPPLPCGAKGIPDNAPCLKDGKLINTSTPNPVPHTPLTEEQKAVLEGTAPQPQPIDPAKVSKDSAAQKTAQSSGYSTPLPLTNLQQQVEEQNKQNEELDRENEQRQQQIRQQQAQQAAQQQQARQAGQQLGAASGNLMITLIIRHRINTFCSKNPGGWWNLSNGTRVHCSDWNAAHGKSK
jgi:hypothetical protein